MEDRQEMNSYVQRGVRPSTRTLANRSVATVGPIVAWFCFVLGLNIAGEFSIPN